MIPGMKPQDFMKQWKREGVDMEAAAKRLGLSVQGLKQYLYGARGCSRKQALVWFIESDGQVSPMEALYPDGEYDAAKFIVGRNGGRETLKAEFLAGLKRGSR